MSNYYYNNIELPALPELSDIDLIKYPFYIILIKNNQAILSFFTTTGYYRTYNNYFDIYPYGERPYYELEYTCDLQTKSDPDTFKWIQTGDSTNFGSMCWNSNVAYLHFSSFDIYYENSERIFFEGSEPIPVEPDPEPEPEPEPEPKKTFCLRSWLTGFTMGLSGKPFHYGKAKEPTAYLYNGIRLPALPEWDKEKYPYAVIHSLFGGALHVFPQNADYFKDYVWSFGFDEYKEGEVGLHWALTETEEGLQWTFSGSVANVIVDDSLIWTNFDILNEDGSVYLAASDPVPVYE